MPAGKSQPPERSLRSIAHVGPAQIRGKRRVGCVQAYELGNGRSGELRDTLRGLPETAAAGAGEVRPS
jgi:hypothetical protein